MNEDARLLAIARRRVAMKRGLRIHATVYACVNAGLVLVNLLGASQHPWSAWPALGWGIGLAAHALSVFAFMPRADGGNQALERELEKLRSQA
ncbi:MAG: 2TM domain-containing protein [Burkholderiaceae bacterium]